MAKTKRSLPAKTTAGKSSAKPVIGLPSWIVFWSLVLCTMIMIVATFTSAIRPFVEPAYDPSADIAQIKQELNAAVTTLDNVEQK